MPLKKKRRRKNIAGKGLGISLQETDAELIQKETFDPDGNFNTEIELGGNDEQLSQTGNSCITKEKGSLEKGQGSLEESHYPGVACGFPEKVAESPREANVSSLETESPPNRAMHLLETEASDVCTNDSDSENNVAPRKKRLRKDIADSGLGISLQEKNVELIQKETCVPDRNFKRGSVLRGNDKQLSQTGKTCVTKEKGSVKNGQCSLEEIHYPGVAGGFPEKAAESPREANVFSPEAECPPNKAVRLLETEASDVCINDSYSENTMRELLQTLNIRSQTSDKWNESELPVCTACAEGSDDSRVDSSLTEIFLGTSKGPRSSTTSQVPHDENFSLSKICASQNTGKRVAEGGQIEEVITQKNHGIPSARHSLTVVSHSCPEDIGIQRQILLSDRQRLPSIGNKIPFRSKIGFHLYHPNFTGFHFSRGVSMIRESPEFIEHQNRGGQNEKGDGSTQGLSVWSEAQSEYFPRGKPSDLGELLEVATRYVVKAWVKGIHPPISGSPINLVIKFCVQCHKKYCYDENESNHLCSKRVGSSQKSLKLMFYVELEIYDETQEMLKVALTGDQATKLFGCQPQEFLGSEELQKRVWDSFKHLIKGGNTQNWCLKDAADFSLEPHLKGKKMNYRVVDIKPFSNCPT